jgi:hypothetical protein
MKARSVARGIPKFSVRWKKSKTFTAMSMSCCMSYSNTSKFQSSSISTLASTRTSGDICAEGADVGISESGACGGSLQPM